MVMKRRTMGRLSMDRNGMSWRMTVWNARAIAMKSAAELGRSHSSAKSKEATPACVALILILRPWVTRVTLLMRKPLPRVSKKASMSCSAIARRSGSFPCTTYMDADAVIMSRKSFSEARSRTSQRCLMPLMQGMKSSRWIPFRYSWSGGLLEVATSTAPSAHSVSKRLRRMTASPTSVTLNSSKQNSLPSWLMICFATDSTSALPSPDCLIPCSRWCTSSMKEWKWERRFFRKEQQAKNTSMMNVFPHPTPPYMYKPLISGAFLVVKRPKKPPEDSAGLFSSRSFHTRSSFLRPSICLSSYVMWPSSTSLL
mmetsp:Transcript_10312/g.24362  ORF Transcript_10312/g.24362 Transcript_10312/m.24362 type:complete len:312 (+) Transcript_10312:614-1549(+)